ncbi:hypothetical protein AB6M97_00925 [Streptococcus hillyeri]|uniref:DUF4064 domain-containing protein n=1 Tax=Streptococcus hillyeri TaxID=2282420 RepID=A0A3L9DVG7_9STRE|nr:hypothetical protein [Streptococcus hillyeri]RLY02760.1 hypothetical protein EAF07_06600 [Streptococcus hillyeri]
MISYEKVRQSFKTWNTTIGVLYILNAVLFLFSLLGGAVNKIMLEKQPEVYASLDEITLEALHLSTTPFALFTFGLGLIVTIVIAVLALINRSKANKNLDSQISYTVYYIGIGWAVISVILEFLMLGTLSLLSPIWVLLFGFFHVFTLRKAQTLKEKEEQ